MKNQSNLWWRTQEEVPILSVHDNWTREHARNDTSSNDHKLKITLESDWKQTQHLDASSCLSFAWWVKQVGLLVCKCGQMNGLEVRAS